MTTVRREALLAGIRQSLSEGRGPFHRGDERFGNTAMYVPPGPGLSKSILVLNHGHTHKYTHMHAHLQYARIAIRSPR